MKKQISNPMSRFNQTTKTVGKLKVGAVLEWMILSNGAVTLAKKIIALIIPSATVILRTKSTVTSKIPAMRAVRRMVMNTRGQ